MWNAAWINHDYSDKVSTYAADSGSYCSATIGTMIGYRANQSAMESSTINNSYGFYVQQPSIDPGATIVNNTGLYFEQQNVGSGANYTIDAGASTAPSRFGGAMTIAGTLQVATSTSNATTTVVIGKTGQNKGSCLELFDSAGNPVYAYVAAGASTFTLSATSCQ